MTLALEWHDFAALTAPALYEILRFRQDVFIVEQACPYPELDGSDAAAHHLLLRADGMLVGYLRLIPAARRVAIGRVAVAAERRRQGLARRLVAAALQRARNDYAGWQIVLSAQAHLADFYRGLGFAAVSAPYDDYGISHVDMTLPPPPPAGL